VEFTGAELRRDPVRLGDEARSTSLFGDRRHIWVRCSGDEAHDALEMLVGGDVALAGDRPGAGATDKSRWPSCWRSATMRWWRCSIRPICARSASVRGMAMPRGCHDQRSGRAHRAGGGLDTRLAASEVAKWRSI
jgi:DNA polymerase-3 subunit delta